MVHPEERMRTEFKVLQPSYIYQYCLSLLRIDQWSDTVHRVQSPKNICDPIVFKSQISLNRAGQTPLSLESRVWWHFSGRASARLKILLPRGRIIVIFFSAFAQRFDTYIEILPAVRKQEMSFTWSHVTRCMWLDYAKYKRKVVVPEKIN